MVNREDAKLAPRLAFDSLERKILDTYLRNSPKNRTLQDYICRHRDAWWIFEQEYRPATRELFNLERN